MKKTILFTILTLSLALVGCVQQTPTKNQNVTQPTTNTNQPAVNTNQNVNTNQPTTPITNQKINYTNSTYGFTLELPNSWRGYKTWNEDTSWGTIGNTDSILFGFGKESLFAIHAFTKSQWQKMGPAPASLKILGEDNNHTFVSEIANDVSLELADRYSEVRSVLATFNID